MGSRSYEARARKFDAKVPGATPFQDKLKEYVVMAPTVGMFGEISKDGESIFEIAAWKRADEYCTFFDSKPSVALSRIKQQMHREVGHCNMLQILRNIRDNMEFLELPGGGSYPGLPESRHEISASRFRQRLDHKKYQISQLSQWTTDELSRERQQGASSANDKNIRQEAVQACSLSLRVLWRRERGQ